MRHRVYGKKLSRDKNERTGLFRSLVGSLILHGSIETTATKAKAIKGLVDRIISQAKSKNTKQLVASFLTQKEVQEKLFKEVVPALKNRTSGFTSVVKLGRRFGDGAMKVRMSLLLEKSRVQSQESSEEIKSQKAKMTKQRHPEPIRLLESEPRSRKPEGSRPRRLVSGSKTKMPKQVRHDSKKRDTSS